MLQRPQFSEPHLFQLLYLHRLSKPGSLSSFLSPPNLLQCSVLSTLWCPSFLDVAPRTCAAIRPLPSCPKPVFPPLRHQPTCVPQSTPHLCAFTKQPPNTAQQTQPHCQTLSTITSPLPGQDVFLLLLLSTSPPSTHNCFAPEGHHIGIFDNSLLGLKMHAPYPHLKYNVFEQF